MILSYQERIDRILNTNHIVLIDDWSIHRVEGVYPLGTVIFIDTGGVKYQDTEVMGSRGQRGFSPGCRADRCYRGWGT